jgi:hypothetical protein
VTLTEGDPILFLLMVFLRRGEGEAEPRPERWPGCLRRPSRGVAQSIRKRIDRALALRWAFLKTLEYRTHRLRRASSRHVVSGSGVSAQREGRVGGAQPLGACAEGAMFWPLGALLKLYFDITL